MSDEVTMPTFDEFVAECRGAQLPVGRSLYVSHPDFEPMYVRCGPRYIRTTLPPETADAERAPFVITLANIATKVQGRGVFTRFLDSLRASHPDVPILVECVGGSRFKAYLRRRGFVRTADFNPEYLPGDFVLRGPLLPAGNSTFAELPLPVSGV